MRIIIFSLLAVVILGCAFQKSKREKFKTYYPNGKLQAITEMEDGKKNGREELYFDNGNLFMVQHFKDDLPVDSFFQYAKEHPNEVIMKGYSIPKSHLTMYTVGGQIFGENYFKPQLVPDGPMIIYNGNGQPSSFTMMKDGKNDGVYMSYYYNGSVKKIEHYKAGKKVPPVMEFDTTGKMIQYIPVTESLEKK